MRTRIFFTIIFCTFLLLQQSCKKTEISKDATETIFTGNKYAERALPHAKKYSADVATAWYNLLTGICRSTPYNPPQSTRIFAYTGLALYESVLPGMPSYQSMFTYFTGNAITFDEKKEYYLPAAANAALARISARLMSNYTSTPNSAIQQLEAQLNRDFQTKVTAEQLQFSNDYGRRVADIIYEWSTTDGTLNSNGTLAACPAYVPLTGAGNWVPTPPAFFPATGACQGSLRTFIPNVVNTTLPPAPPEYSSLPGSAFYEMAIQVNQTKLAATAGDILIGEAWRDRLGLNYNTPAHLLKLTTNIIDKEQINLEDASVIYAKEGIAMFDAIAAAFHAKFYYSLLRPITYIRNVMGIANWNSQYPTPQHPSYPAVAPGAAASAIIILKNSIGADYSFTDSTQQALYGSWNYSSFDQLLQDVGKSRTHTGLNFQIAVTEGIKQGNTVGNMINNLPFKKP